MIDRIIFFSVHNKLITGLLLLAVMGWGAYSVTQLPIDALPDVTNNQVLVNTVAPNLATQEVEQFITFPLEQACLLNAQNSGADFRLAVSAPEFVVCRVTLTRR
mgnify:CR=1 FL=1